MERVEAEVSIVAVRGFKQVVPPGWVLCEFDMDWNKGSQEMGAAWILNDENGRVLMHSRRAFSNLKSLGEAKMTVWMWVLESMKSLRMLKVIFLSTFADVVEAMEKPGLWPVLQI